MRLERILYYPLQTPMTGVFYASVGGSSLPANVVTTASAAVTTGGGNVTSG